MRLYKFIYLLCYYFVHLKWTVNKNIYDLINRAYFVGHIYLLIFFRRLYNSEISKIIVKKYEYSRLRGLVTRVN